MFTRKGDLLPSGVVMLHTVLIAGHATAGVVALVLGCVVLKPPTASRVVVFRLYLGALLTLVALLVAVVVVDWPGLETGERVTFAPLTVLGLYTSWRGLRARRALVDRPTGWRSAYVDHVGFTLISLFDGFAIVGAIDLGAPVAAVVAVGVAGVVVGIVAVTRVRSRLEQEQEQGPRRQSASTGTRRW